MSYDIIGDIHGHAEALEALLTQMGYRDRMGCWRHPDRQAIFVGDFIDRGPEQLRTVNIARRMVEGGAAMAVMGNHEFNAIAWHTPDSANPGEFLRPNHSPKWGDKNRKQHAAFLDEVGGKPDLHREIVDWFMTLPLWLDLPGIRVVHACWHETFMAHLSSHLREGHYLTREAMPRLATEPEDPLEKDSPAPSPFKAIEAIAKGKEVRLPDPHHFLDKDGIRRDRVRVRWWDPLAIDFRSAAMLPEAARSQLPTLPIPDHARIALSDSRPTFFGHYRLTGTPAPLGPHVACLDDSVAKGGALAAYRWDGEPTLKAESFVHVGDPRGMESGP